MSDFAPKYVLAFSVVVLILVAGVLIQNWLDSRNR